MEQSLFLAQFWGWLMLIISLIFLLKNKKFIKGIYSMVGERLFSMPAGYIALILGLVTIITHNIWASDWRVVITIFGWMSLIKGVMLIGFSSTLEGMVKYFQKNTGLIKFMLFLMAILSIWLISVS